MAYSPSWGAGAYKLGDFIGGIKGDTHDARTCRGEKHRWDGECYQDNGCQLYYKCLTCPIKFEDCPIQKLSKQQRELKAAGMKY